MRVSLRPFLKRKYLPLLALPPVALFLAVPPPLIDEVSFSRAVTDRRGELLRLTLADDQTYRLYTPLNEISPTLVDAVLLHEDRHFRSHPGINPVALARAGWQTLTGTTRIGASTLTMQLVRLKYRLHTRGIGGKLAQMALALRYELHYSKDAILETYLNLAPYGYNIEGVGAASHIYFGRDAAKLSLPEALSLAVLPQSPTRRTPGKNAKSNAALAAARGRLFARWQAEHPQDARLAALMTLPLHYGSPRDLPFLAPQLTTRLLRENQTPRIVSTLDIALQRQLAGLVKRYARAHRDMGVANAATLLVDTRSMDVLASVGSADYFDRAAHGMVDGTRARRSPGSALKPFIYALAFDQGIIHPLSLMKDAPRSFAGFAPENYDRDFQGPISAHDALIRSRNIPALTLAEQLRKPTFLDFLRRAGVRKLKSGDPYGLSLVLGGAEVTMEELVRLYAMLAGDGRLAPLRYVKGVAQASGPRLLSPEAAFLTLDILRDTSPPGGAAENDALPFPVSWKTGTSNGLRDAWSVGVFGPYALAVWVGDFRGGTRGQVVGIATAAPLFFDLARSVIAREKPTDLLADKARHLRLSRAEACADTGDIGVEECPVRASVWLIPGVSPIRPTGIYRKVLIDTGTGQESCRFVAGRTAWRTLAYWPSDLIEVYRLAGIRKESPPARDTSCATAQVNSDGPRIVSPAKGVTYRLRTGADNRLPLKAVFDGGASSAFWFVGDVPLGKGAVDEATFWPMKRGAYVVRVVDDRGRADSRRIVVE